MNYRHSYHAGGFADVFKHIILSLVIDALEVKETPFTYLDTHAGRGLYWLDADEAQKKQEYRFGIERLMAHHKTFPAPECLTRYLDLIASLNFDDRLNCYPGSPKIAEAFLREQDALILCELHPEEFSYLKENIGRGDRRIALHHTDAYLSMKAFLPPKTARGLVHIDPPFEKTNEFEMIVAALKLALKHWRMGQFMIWYPIKDRREVERFQLSIQPLNVESLFVEFFMNDTDVSSNLMGCGVALINPPWKLKERLSDVVLPYLGKALQGHWEINLGISH